MLPTPCIGKTSKKLGKQSFVLGGILPPPARLKCVDICFCTAAAKKWFLAMQIHSCFLFFPGALRSNSISASKFLELQGSSTQRALKYELMMSYPESAGAWGLGQRISVKYCHQAISQNTGGSSQWDGLFPDSPIPTALPLALLEKGKIHLPPGPWKRFVYLLEVGSLIMVFYMYCLQDL